MMVNLYYYLVIGDCYNDKKSGNSWKVLKGIHGKNPILSPGSYYTPSFYGPKMCKSLAKPWIPGHV